MTSRRHLRVFVLSLLTVATAFAGLPPRADAQFKKRLLQIGACGGGAFAGAKLGDKLAEIEARRLNLTPEEAAKRKRAFQIGMAIALCGGGAIIAGTTYSRLSRRGQEARQRELLDALEDAQPRTYTDPEKPSLQGRITPQASTMEGDKECRIVEDYLADTTQGDAALVKYCRPPNGAWKVEVV